MPKFYVLLELELADDAVPPTDWNFGDLLDLPPTDACYASVYRATPDLDVRLRLTDNDAYEV